MTAKLIDGRALAQSTRERVHRQVDALRAAACRPCLVGVLVGDDQGSRMYAESQARAAAELGIEHRVVPVTAGAHQSDVLREIDALNRDAAVHGILVYQPLPPQFDPAALQAAIAYEKDVEGVNPTNLGLLAIGRPALPPCTAAAAFECIKATGIEIAGRDAVVIGRSAIVGRPVAMLLLAAHATVTQCHTRTRDLESHGRRADILVVSAGKPLLIGRDHVKPGAIVIDVGTHRVAGEDGKSKTVGDVRFEEVSDAAGYITPVPGGVGPVTVVMLMSNLVTAAARQSVGS